MPLVSDKQAGPTLTIGQRLEVGIGNEAVDWYPSRVEDLADETLSVAWPMDRQRALILVAPGEPIQVTASARDDAAYSARATIVRTHRDGVPVLTISLAGPWQRAQRRGDVRIPVAIRPRLAVLQRDGKLKQLRCGITNLSAGGVQLKSQDELRLGDQVELAFELLGVPEEVHVTSTIRRVQRFQRDGNAVLWEAGCAFNDLAPRLASKLVQFIFAQQRLLARARKAGE